MSIDCRLFSHSSDQLLEAIPIEPSRGDKKQSTGQSGTVLVISALTAEWTEERLREVAVEEFSRLTDPFSPKERYRVVIRFNGAVIPTSSISRHLLKAAHATCTGVFVVDRAKETCSVEGQIDYVLRNHTKRRFALRKVDLLRIAELSSLDTLYSLGPFRFEI